ncbi:MAG: TIGR04282 family arsenosugar biosynthesis glycosyltransferase [Myxococcota bacterium]
MAMTVGIGVMAKAPVPGHCKTRLTPPLTPVQAARLYEALLLDTLDLVRSIPGVRKYVFVAPEHDGVTTLQRLAPDAPVIPQPAGNLGVRLDAALQHMLSHGCDAAMMLGSDAPIIPLQEAVTECAWLTAGPQRRALLGPADDGGYYLIGVARHCPELFHDVPWSTEQVAEVTRQRAREAGVVLRELGVGADVDDVAGLRALASHRRGAARTRALLDEKEYQAVLSASGDGSTGTSR